MLGALWGVWRKYSQPDWWRVAIRCDFRERLNYGTSKITKALPAGYWYVYIGPHYRSWKEDRLDADAVIAKCRVEVEGTTLTEFELPEDGRMPISQGSLIMPRRGSATFFIDLEPDKKKRVIWLHAHYAKQEVRGKQPIDREIETLAWGGVITMIVGIVFRVLGVKGETIEFPEKASRDLQAESATTNPKHIEQKPNAAPDTAPKTPAPPAPEGVEEPGRDAP